MFRKYNSIENSYQQKFLDVIKREGFWDKTYVVQEKAHGANLSFWTTDGQHFKSGKRTSPLGSEDVFYNHMSLMYSLLDGFKAIWNELAQQDLDVTQMTIFGEVIGGGYPHKDVARNNKAKKVQKGIFYSPNNEFYAFDIRINNEYYLSVDETNRLFIKAHMLYAKTLYEGSLEECLKYPNQFRTEIPRDLGLPEIEPNNCEGVIIKPKEDLYFGGGSRVILKNKNEKWSENTKFNKIIQEEEVPSENVLLLQEAVLTYITENRLNNVLSKIGPVSIKDFGKILGMMSKDVHDDFVKDYEKVFNALEKREQKMISKAIGKPSAVLLRSHFESVKEE